MGHDTHGFYSTLLTKYAAKISPKERTVRKLIGGGEGGGGEERSTKKIFAQGKIK